MSIQHMFLRAIKKNMNTFWLKTKTPYLELCELQGILGLNFLFDKA